MSQQAAAGRGPGAAGRGVAAGRGKSRFRFHSSDGDGSSKGFKLAVLEITNNTFNTGHNKCAAQFSQSRKNVVNYLQRMSNEGYLIAQTVWTGKKQVIKLPEPVDQNSTTATDDATIRAELVKAIGKRQMKLADLLMKGYTTVYGQCSQEVKDKLEGSDNWERIQSEQSLHKLIQKIKRICVGFDDHKQEVFYLVQSLKLLFLYMQNKSLHFTSSI
jgi:hypothetical protein